MLTIDEEFELAKNLDIAIRGLGKQLRIESIAEFKILKDDVKLGEFNYWGKIFTICVSLSQGEKSKIGKRFETLVFDCIDKISTAKIERQWRTPGFVKKPLDGYLCTVRCDFYFSLAHSTRERKEGTWNNEYGIIESRQKKENITKPYRFVCIANEPDEEAFGKLRAKLSAGIELVSTQNRDAMRILLTSIAAADIK